MSRRNPIFAIVNAALRQRLLGAVLLALSAVTTPAPLVAQWSTTYEQFYLQASHNWVFRKHYQQADRLFNAFDFGHAILYETLWRFPNAPASELEQRRYDQLTKQVLIKPPRVPLEEGAIEPRYAQLAPEAKVMFDWAHLLHRQLYDVLADERLTWERRDAEVARLVRYYRSRPDLAFSSKPKTMKLMQEQPYSLAFRKKYPRFNGLIWGYHWLQMGLYEPFMVGRTPAEKQALVSATVARFFQMLTDAPRSLPHQMPMSAVVAPTFAARYVEAAIIFDNLHSMHDVVSDILTNPSVPRDRKRAAIMLAARHYRDDSTEVMPVPAWRAMSVHMGIENMGGPAVGFLSSLPVPSVTFGAVMQHEPQTGAMTGFGYGGSAGAGVHSAHEGAAEKHQPSPGPTSIPAGSHVAPSTAACITASESGYFFNMTLNSLRPILRCTSLAVSLLAAGATSTSLSAQASPATTTSSTVNAADVSFMQGMIGHHAQALEMSALVAGRASSPQLPLLAERITVSQRDEIAIMQRWLFERGQAVPDTTGRLHDMHAMHAMHGSMTHAMPGMLSPAQMDSLEAARGAQFDRLFLEYMIQHHEGALTMVAQLLASPAAARDPMIFQFASDVDTDQRAEIRRMRTLLSTLR